MSRHVLGTCRACGIEHTYLRQAAGERSDPADDTGTDRVTICVTCGEFSLLENGPFGLVLRAPTDDELAELVTDPGVIHARKALQETWECHRPPTP